MDEKDPQGVHRLGVSVIVTGDLASYKQVAEALQLEQQICQFHVQRWVGQAVHERKQSLPPEWVRVTEEVRQILRDLPIEGDKCLMAISRQFPLVHGASRERISLCREIALDDRAFGGKLGAISRVLLAR